MNERQKKRAILFAQFLGALLLALANYYVQMSRPMDYDSFVQSIAVNPPAPATINLAHSASVDSEIDCLSCR